MEEEGMVSSRELGIKVSNLSSVCVRILVFSRVRAPVYEHLPDSNL